MPYSEDTLNLLLLLSQILFYKLFILYPIVRIKKVTEYTVIQ